jgi:exodeoxyribonuclease VII large subunit
MPRTVKSQWDLGELFPPEALRQVLTVAQLTASVKRLLEREIGAVWVTGEITNLRQQNSGHVYFSLKDGAAQLNCVLFRAEARMVPRDILQDGKKVVLRGGLTVYEARGQYQLRVLEVELEGEGALQAAFEKLKQKLKGEGLFETARKRPLPRYPCRIGLVTSPSGAAIQDVAHVIQRRQASLEVLLVPCRVQGQGAAFELAEAIRLLNLWSEGCAGRRNAALEEGARKLDLILITRGGGSLEDLWAFNEEVVARAIFESKLPVVSAVGHEIDFTISDFVADVRAATPSVAAELITEGCFSCRQFVADARRRLRSSLAECLDALRERTRALEQRLGRVHPRRRLNERWQRLDDLQTALSRCGIRGWRIQKNAWTVLMNRLLRLRPSQALVQRREKLERLRHALLENARSGLAQRQIRLTSARSRLRLLSPLNVLERGYSITSDAGSGRVVRSSAELKPGQRIKTRLQSGAVESVVEKTENSEES